MADSQNTPLTAQLLKRARRLSLAGARSAHTLRAPSGLDSGKRRSTLLSTPAQNKRTSIYGALGALPGPLAAGSVYGSYSQSSVATPYASQTYSAAVPSLGAASHSQTLAASQKRPDPRPLRDKNYQGLILKEIYDFCVANKFELEMNHSVSMKTLRQPTQKDFVLLFQFLYGKVDPSYRFTRSIDTEVFVLLRNLQYPYLDGINRLSISAVGGQNWPSFLGMLYWLVNLNLTLSQLTDEAFIAPDDIFDHVFIKYILSSYTSFIEQKEDYTENYNAMKREYDAATERISLQLAVKLRNNRDLLDQFSRLSKQAAELDEAEAKSVALENDLRQFSEYMAKMKERQTQWSEILEQMEAEINNAEVQLKDLEEQKDACKEVITQKGYTIQDVDRQLSEKDKLTKQIAAISNKIEDFKEATIKKNSELVQSYQSLESFLAQYNLMTLRLLDESRQYELALNPNILEEDAPVEADDILNRKLREEKIKLLQRRSELNQEVLRLQEESIKIVDQVDQCCEKIFEQLEEVEALEAEVTKHKATQEEIYETMVSEGTSYSAQIEKLDRDLQGMQINANRGVIEAETRNKNLKIQFQETKYAIKEKREQLHETVHGLLQYVILFKLNIQEKFEELEKQVGKELEDAAQSRENEM